MTPEALFADRCVIRLLENLDPAGRAHFLAQLSKEARERLGVTASANRRRQRNDLIVHATRQLSPGVSANRAAAGLEGAAERYMRRRWEIDRETGNRPLAEPERSIARILELSDGRFPSARSIRRLLEIDL